MDEPRNRLRRKNTRSGRSIPRARARQHVRLYREKPLFGHIASPERRLPRRRRRARHQSEFRLSLRDTEQRRNVSATIRTSEVRCGTRLSPRDPTIGLGHNLMAGAELGLGHFDAAIDEANKAIDAGWRSF